MLENDSLDRKKTETAEIVKEELSPYRAQGIFENSIITGLNETLSDEQQIHSDEPSKLDWNVDEETGEINFSIVKRTPTKEAPTGVKGARKIDQKTGKKYIDYTLSPMEQVTTYPLETSDVAKVFKKLERNVKETFIQGFEEVLAVNKSQQEKLTKALKTEVRQDEKEEMEQRLDDYKKDYTRVEKMLRALK